MEECSRLERENAEFKLKELNAVGQQQQAKLEVL
jgi:ATP-dependent Clp protease adapter protein ClpS